MTIKLNKRNKVLIFIDWFLPAYKAGGPIQSISNLVKRLKNEIDIWIVTSNEDLGEPLKLDRELLNIWLCKDKYHVIYLDRNNRNLNKYREILNSNNFESIYFNSLFSIKFTLLPLWMCHKMDIKLILAPRGMLGKGALSIKPLRKKIFIQIFKALKMHEKVLWHATDVSEKKEIKKHFGQKSTITVVPNLSSKTTEYIEKSKQARTLNLFFLSRITIKKRLLYALNILKEIKKSHLINFTIIGPIDDQNYWKECQSAILKLPNHIKINYLGPIPNHKLKKILSSQHVLFLPTQHENFGHVIVESWQNGCPVLISENTPWKNLESQKVGFNLPLENHRKFKEVIEFFSLINQKEFNEWSYSSNKFAQSITENHNLILQTKNIFNNSVL